MARHIHVVVLVLLTASALLQLARWLRVARAERFRSSPVRTTLISRLLLLISLALGYHEIYAFVDGLFRVPALPQLLQHLAALGVVYYVQASVFRLVLPEEQAAGATRVWSKFLLLCAAGLMTCYVLGPLPNHMQDIASRFVTSPFVVEYQIIVVTFLGITSASLLWVGVRYAPHARGFLAAALWVLGTGGALSLLTMAYRFLYLMVHAAGGTLPWQESGVDGLQIYLTAPALVCILLGISMPKWGPKLMAWHSHRRLFRALRPLWLALYRDDNGIALVSPRPLLMEALIPYRLRFHLHRRVIEIRDALIGPLRNYLDPAVYEDARRRGATQRIAEPELSAVAEAACIKAALRARARNHAPRGTGAMTLHHAPTDLDGDASWLAAVSTALASSTVVAAVVGRDHV
jgi:hypothetical protein